MGVYRKRFPTGESVSSGNKLAVYNSKFGKFGILICFDAENPVALNETLVILRIFINIKFKRRKNLLSYLILPKYRVDFLGGLISTP